MEKRKIAFAQRLEQDSKNYKPKDLFDLEAAKAFFTQMNEIFGLETLLTDRHGNIIMTIGSFEGFRPDVVNAPGIKIRVKGRTVSHIYAKYDKTEEARKEIIQTTMQAYIKTLEGYSEKSYLCSEQAVYIDELEQKIEKEAYQAKYGEQNDPLTGVLNRTYFRNRMKNLKEREIVPTAVITVNINDWKFVDDNFGEEESDRLIVTVADILKKNTDMLSAGNKTVIGRIEGDVFQILLPLAEEEEAHAYCQKIQQDCQAYEDEILAPSIAVGCVMKTNVEQSFKALLSDAEYEMLENKLQIKKAPGYRERLEKGIKREF